MNYSQIINLIFSILFGLVGLFLILFFIFFLVGIFRYKTFPKAKKKASFGILISARNEEKVIGDIIKNLQNTDYPKDKIKIFVVAHNCEDKTAEIARENGASVYVYNNPNERTKGYALNYLTKQIIKNFGISICDAYFVFDADNLVAKNYFDKMNDAYQYYGGKSIITSFRNSKNFASNTMSGLYGIYFALGCFSEFRGRTVLNVSTRVSGTGYVVPAYVLKDEWKYLTLTEDWEMSADQVLDSCKIYYCDEATFYDEQPTTFSVMWRQRVRWSRGHILVFKNRIRDFFKQLFSKHNKIKVSTYDTMVNCQPWPVYLMILALLQLILTFLSPLFGISLKEAFFGEFYSSDNIFMSILIGNSAIFSFIRMCILGYLGCVLTAIVTFILSRNRLYKLSIWRKIWICFLWPFFIALQFPIDIQAIFSRNLEWKTIPHTNDKQINN